MKTGDIYIFTSAAEPDHPYNGHRFRYEGEGEVDLAPTKNTPRWTKAKASKFVSLEDGHQHSFIAEHIEALLKKAP